MSINPITERDFAGFPIEREAIASMLYEEREWFRNVAGNILGILIMDKIDKDYCYVVLGLDQNGRFRAIDMEIEAGSEDETRNKLIACMQRYEATGQKVFPQT